jgi:peroxiredoxin
MRTLSRQLESFFTALLDRTDPSTAATLRHVQGTLADSELTHQARKAGDMAPDFSLPDQHGRIVTLSAELARGPVVLTFFRGGWCPFCSITLRALANAQESIRRAGASLIAIAPQSEAGIRATAETQGLDFPLLSDHGNAVARSYGLVWHLDAEAQAIYRRLGHDVPAINGAPGWELPMPAGYVIKPSGRICRARVDARATHRLEPAEALAALAGLHADPQG